MNVPVSKVNVLGDRYSIRAACIKDLGVCRYLDLEIVFNPKQSIDQVRDTLLHEVIHAIDNVESLRMKEDQVRRIATGLRAVFTANPKFAKFVSE